MSLSLILAVGCVAAITYVGVRDHRAAKAARRGLLDRCVDALDRAELRTRPTASRAFPATIRGAQSASTSFPTR